MPPEGPAADIDVWSWPLDASPDVVDGYAGLLSVDEISRADRYIHGRDRRRYIVGRGRLRLILSAYCGVEPRRLVFEYNAHGKPRLAMPSEPPLHFNLSHSAEQAALAVCDRYEIGIDIEEIRFLQEDIASRFFSKKECAALAALPKSQYLDGFYRCWTRKEAFVKAYGAGLSLPLDSFDVSLGEKAAELERLDGDPEAGENWTLFPLDVGRNFAGAIAVRANRHSVSIRYRSA